MGRNNQPMSGAARVAGAVYREVMIAGKSFRLSQPRMVGFYADIEAFIIGRRKNPVATALQAMRVCSDDMSPEDRQMILEIAAEQASKATIVTNEEIKAFEKSRLFSAFVLWKSLDPKHYDEVPTVEAAMELIEADVAENGTDHLAEVMADANIVQQENELKNSAGQSETLA